MVDEGRQTRWSEILSAGEKCNHDPGGERFRGNYIFTSEIQTRLWKQGLDSYSLCFLSSLTRFLKGKIQYIKQIISQLYTSAHTRTHGAQNAAKGRLWLWNWHYLFSSHSCTVQRQSRNHQVCVFQVLFVPAPHRMTATQRLCSAANNLEKKKKSGQICHCL